jgi:type II restriction/modification system DNA methylase subunit YeeA
MSDRLVEFLKVKYADSKTDLYSVFIEKCGAMCKKHGYRAMITQHGWMFLSSFEKLRNKLLREDIVNLVHLGARAFDEISGEVVQTVSFVIRNTNIKLYRAKYVRLLNAVSEKGKEDLFLSTNNRYIATKENFKTISGMPVAYWFSDSFFRVFTNQKLSDVAKPRQGLATGDNERFLRLWSEVDMNKIGYGMGSRQQALQSKKKWFPCNKGGTFRKWYGNYDYVVNWEKDGIEIRNNYGENGKLKSRPQNIDYYYKEGMTWSTIASGSLAMRYSPVGHMFETKGAVCFADNKEQLYYLIGLMNIPIVSYVLSVLSPTLDFHEGPLGKVPTVICKEKQDEVNAIVNKLIENSKKDWNSFENSWNFKRHPLLSVIPRNLALFDDINDIDIAESYTCWENECNERFNQLKANEEELNRIFIDIYGLQDELTSEVEDKDVTVRKADLKRDIKSLISYAVGCMFGRYSLDEEGLILAGQPFESHFFEASAPRCGTGFAGAPGMSLPTGEFYYKTQDGAKKCSFNPDKDNIIPITDEEYLEDDMVSRFCTWLKVAFGEKSLEKNLEFIAKALGNKGDTNREIIRNYFLNDFFKDHCNAYSVTGSGKRPIYWLFDSGKQNGFKALVYLHRYNADTIGNVRVDYLYRMQRVYESEIGRMQDTIDNSKNSREVSLATKRKEKLQKQLKECREYDEKIGHLALSRIELDLDDGMKVNYRKVQTAADGKFYEILADSKNIMAKQ